MCTNSIVVGCCRVCVRRFVHVFVLRYETVPGFIGRTLNVLEDDGRSMVAEKWTYLEVQYFGHFPEFDENADKHADANHRVRFIVEHVE